MKIVVAVIVAVVAMETASLAQPTAEDLYAEGQAAYDKADYPTAIAKWQASFDLSSEVGLLFNIAQARRLVGDCPGALATYRRFVAADADPSSEQHKLAEDLSRELERSCPPRKTATTAPAPTSAVPRPDDHLRSIDGLDGARIDGAEAGRGWKIAGLATGGAGIGMLATGLAFGYRARTASREIMAACAVSCNWSEQRSKDAKGRRDARIGYALDAVGAAAIAGGAVMYYLGVREGTILVERKTGTGTVISWSGSW